MTPRDGATLTYKFVVVVVVGVAVVVVVFVLSNTTMASNKFSSRNSSLPVGVN